MKKFYFEKNMYDEIANMKMDESEFKEYPGSEKGPRPEDDPEHYSKWFVENQPSFLKGSDFSELGYKTKNIANVRDTSERTEVHHMASHFLVTDELYPLQHYVGSPEFAILERDKYNVEKDEDLPAVAVSSNMKPDELPPMPYDHTYNYQEFHPELEKWALFRAFPMLKKYDNAMVHFFKQLSQGTLFVPDVLKNINPPSLWSYYETLPKWARDNPGVRNVMMAFEYHKPTMDIK